ncbi:and other transporter-domain-containing protein [Naematelia encephala]|uniref:And other transporter-domain-containing protein n=1 Tax=Naematelia encephala TaxID=71784 RepID=A0A1Y2BEW9_9TREE|nr:and other transporter-domain-containing protein [Naematelia encephala]
MSSHQPLVASSSSIPTYSAPSTGSSTPTARIRYPPSSPTNTLDRKLRSLTHPSGGGYGSDDDDHSAKSSAELIRSREGSIDNVEDLDGLGEVDESAVVVEGEDSATPFVWGLVGSASIAGLLFGYDTGVISGTLVIIGTDLGGTLTDWQKEMITSSTTLGALIGGLAAGSLSDIVGRRPIIALANVVFIGGAICQAGSHTVSSMVVGRLIVGLGVGLASCIVPLYIGELAPTRIRGRLVTINVVFVTLGQLAAYAIGSAFENVSSGWRWMVGFGAVPALIQLCSLGLLPESPRILLLRSRSDSARDILAKIYPRADARQLDAKVQIMNQSVKQSVLVTQSTIWSQRAASLFKDGANRRALIIGGGLQAAQQLCGFNTLMYYSASIFASLGFKNATGTGCIIAGVNFIFTLVALRIVDPFGRRRTMIATLPMMVIALILASVFFHKLTASTGGVLQEGYDYPPTYASAILLAMMLYVAAYASGLGNIPWQQGELFRLEVRGLGSSICTAINWSCNLVISATFLSLMRTATPSGAFGIYAGFCFLSWIFCILVYPETSGLSLEEVFFIFQDDFGVDKSRRLREAKAEKLRIAHRRLSLSL